MIYTVTKKLEIAREWVYGNGTQDELARKYNIKSANLLKFAREAVRVGLIPEKDYELKIHK